MSIYSLCNLSPEFGFQELKRNKQQFELVMLVIIKVSFTQIFSVKLHFNKKGYTDSGIYFKKQAKTFSPTCYSLAVKISHIPAIFLRKKRCRNS